MNNKELIKNVIRLSIPAILTQIASIVMQYIDSAMVGQLGKDASAAIGLVSSSTWVLGGFVFASAIGFSVQVAHQIGAKNPKQARIVVKHGLIVSMLLAFIVMIVGLLITKPLPIWLRADTLIHLDASLYFLVYVLSIPFMQLSTICASYLQCSGDMVIPSILNTLMCILDVIFNMFFIPRFGVLGASIGTGLATVIVSLFMFYFCCFRNENLKFHQHEKFEFDVNIIKTAFKIGTPVCAEQVATSLASVVLTGILAPLGTLSIAAHSFAITAESLCYMPGYGLEGAATTLVGQAFGAKDPDLAKKYANISTILGATIMGITGIVMFIFCPFVFKMLTPDIQVQALGVQVLRIGLIAEPLFGVSIVSTGALRGIEDTFVPGILNLFSVWVIRIGLALLLIGPFGLYGIWAAMAIDLCFRGIVLFIRQQKSPYFKKTA